MNSLIVEIVGIVAPVLIIPLIAYLWVRAGQSFNTRFTGEITLYIASPALVFSGLTRVDQPLQELGLMMGACFIAIVGMCMIGFICLKLSGLSVRTYLNSIMLPNMGNIGLPVCYFAFGEKGLAFAVACMVTMSFMTFSFGVIITGGFKAMIDLVKLPNIYALGAATAFLLTDTDVPLWLRNTSGLLGDFAIPMMLLTLGAAMANMRIVNLPATTFVTFLRFSIGISMGWGIGYGLGLSPVAQAILILQCAMPVAVYNFVLAQRYQINEDQVTSIILSTTACSLMIIPMLLWLLL